MQLVPDSVLSAKVKLNQRHATPIAKRNSGVYALSIAHGECPPGDGHIGKKAEIVDGFGNHAGNFVPVVLVAHHPIAVAILLEDLGQAVGAVQCLGNRTAETVVVYNAVGSTMEHACWGWWEIIGQVSHTAVDSPRIRNHSYRTERWGQGCSLGQVVGTAIVGLEYTYCPGTAACKDDVGGVDMQLVSMLAQIGNGFGTILDSIADGGVKKGVSREDGGGVHILQIQAVVDGHNHKSPIGQRMAASQGLLVVPLAAQKAAAEHVENTCMVLSGQNGLVDIHHERHGVALGIGKGLLRPNTEQGEHCNHQ